MAFTGIVLVGFVVGHMLGNLQMFLPDHEAINDYGRFLRHALHGTGLWVVRAVLLASVILHIAAAWSLTRTNLAARPVAYRVVTPDASTYASRTMRWSGPILALFIVYHLLHFTVGNAHPAFVEGDVYRNVIVGFSVWPVALALHRRDARPGPSSPSRRGSMLQSLGASHPRWNSARDRAATALTVIVVLGFISVPLAVLAGVLK